MNQKTHPSRRFSINKTVVYSNNFPLNVTKAVDTIAAISHRNDTIKVIGEREYGPLTSGYFVPVSNSAMVAILGEEIALKFVTAMQDPACAEYYRLVITRLRNVGIMLSHSDQFWLICKVPHIDGSVDLTWLYNTADLNKQKPAGTTAG